MFPFYFLSDNHLSTQSGPAQDKRIADILILLDEIRKSKGTLFILGDFFDFWFDKNDYIPPVLKPVISSLKQIIEEGIEIHYVGGNHDYWIEGFLTCRIGIRFYPDALRFEMNGMKVYCEHGDNAVYPNEQYLWVRKLIRNPLAISMLKLLPIHLTYKLGERVSHYNNETPDTPSVQGFYVLKMKEYLENKLNEGYHLAVSGHIHSPFYENKEGGTIAMLGDWINHRSYGYMDSKGFKLIDQT